MLRVLTIYFFVVTSVVHVSSYAADEVVSSDPVKAEFVKTVPLPKGARRLLGGSGDRMYFSGAAGSVAEIDLDGKLLHTFQAKEDGNFVLKKPEAVALGTGMIYVADGELNHIAMFSMDGKYQGSFGGKKGGFFSSGGEQELKTPRGVVFHEGIVYVLDGGTKRILMFGSNGVFLNSLEIKSGTSSNAFKSQAEVYKLHEPVGIEVDGAGRLYVMDAEDFLVKVYSSDGGFLHAIPLDDELMGFTIAQDGVYVAKSNELTIKKYDFSDRLLCRFGGKGEGAGQFKSLSGLVALKDRQIALADPSKGVVDFFTTDAGTPIEKIPKLATRIFVQSTTDVIPIVANKLAWNGKDTLYGIDEDQSAVVVIRNGNPDKPIKLADMTPIAVAVDVEGKLWILDKKKYRVIKLDVNGKIISSFGSAGDGDGQFVSPTDLLISSSGRIYVADKGSNSVQIFDSDGKFLSAIRKLDNPTSIAVDAQENLYILESAANAVSIYSAQGGLIGNFGKVKGEGALLKPVALMATLDEIFALDGDRVKVYSHKGEYIRSFGAKGTRLGDLDEPVAMAKKDDISFFIAERSNKRIQTFVTQYKPVAPQRMVSKSEIHSIELNWETLPYSYIKQYLVYRSKEEHAGFVRVGTTISNQFIDRGLEADGSYFYRIAAETTSGYEGATSALVNGISKRYTPPVLAGVDVVATPVELKLKWKAVESEFVNSYIVYQKDINKEGNTFTKVGETITPEFTKDSLTPNTKYTYYVAVHSSDGTESEKLEVNATTLPYIKAPLEIEVLSLRPIFANTYKRYEKNGVGTIKLTNNTQKTIDGITLSFLLKDFMDFGTETKIGKLLSGQSTEVKLKAIFNNNILDVTADISAQATLEANYNEGRKRQSYSKVLAVSLYEKHKLLWDEPDRYASFITPDDPPLMSFSRSIVTQYPEIKDEVQLASIVFNALGVYGLTYVQDPKSSYQITSGKKDMVDNIQFPRETLERKSGDCDDLVALYVAALESQGIATRVIEVPEHMFMMFSTGVKAEKDAYTMDNMYVIYDDTLWIPVETTVVGSSFVKAWKLGAANYYKWKDNGLVIQDISQAWQDYKPASLAESKWKPDEVSKESIDKKFPNEFVLMLKIIAQTKMRHYRQHIDKDPKDVDSHLQIGIILAKLGERQEAMKYFDKVISLQPDNAEALNNRGNLFMIDGKYTDAKKAYIDAAKASPDDLYILINLVKALKALNEIKEAKKAFAGALRLDPGIKKKYKALSLELSNKL